MWSAGTGVGEYPASVRPATASAKHTERLEALGAEVVFDYREADVGRKINAYTVGTLRKRGLCEISQGDIVKADGALGKEGGVFRVIGWHDPVDFCGKKVGMVMSYAYTVRGKVQSRRVRLRAGVTMLTSSTS